MIFAYPERPCLRAGEKLRLHLSTDAPEFSVRFFRWGASVEEVPYEHRTLRGEFADFEIPASWRPGAYVAAFDNGAIDAREARALFTIYGGEATPPLLVVLPLFTYHAYNVAQVDGTRGEDEGECLYSGAPWVSLHRPGGGVGGHPWDEVNQDVYDLRSPRQTFAHWDAKAIAWLERNGYEFDCVTDMELDDPAFDLQRYNAIASFGHHEYWTQRMRDRADAYIASGGNVAFFGGNTCWFRAEYDAKRRAIRRAGRWIENPEWRTTGVSYAFGGGKWIGPRPPTGYTVRNARHWLFAGLGLEDGDVFGAQERLIGYECDGAPNESDLDIAAEASIKGWPVEDGSGEVSDTARAALGVRTNNGSVFTASTVDWARVLFAGEHVVGGITAHVLARFGAGAPVQRFLTTVR